MLVVKNHVSILIDFCNDESLEMRHLRTKLRFLLLDAKIILVISDRHLLYSSHGLDRVYTASRPRVCPFATLELWHVLFIRPERCLTAIV